MRIWFHMGRLFCPRLFCAAALTLGLSGAAAVSPAVSPTLAQTQAETDEALAQLSEILGALAHLEDLCEQDPNSRQDMETLLESEELNTVRQSVLIDAFNRGFRGVANTHQRCTSASERLIDRHHNRGAAIISNLLDG